MDDQIGMEDSYRRDTEMKRMGTDIGFEDFFHERRIGVREVTSREVLSRNPFPYGVAIQK